MNQAEETATDATSEEMTNTEIIVAVRPAERQDCQDIYNLSRAQLSIIQSTTESQTQTQPEPSCPTGHDDDERESQPRPRLMSAKELERDGFDTTPPLFHCLVATTAASMSSVIIDNQRTADAAEAEGTEREDEQERRRPRLRKNNDELHEKSHNYPQPQHQHQPADLASSPPPSTSTSTSKTIVVGYALYFISYPVWEGRSIQLANLCVDPKCDGKDRERIGRALLAELAQIAIDGGYADIRLVLQENDGEMVKLVEGNHGVNFGKKEDWNWFTIDGAGLRALTSPN